MARRLHEALESYDLPDGVLINGRESFSPIFRDVTELTAAHSLSEKIRQALEQSSFLIVLCSPASKDSHWVNEEIRLFRELHGDRAILSAIVEGTPTTSFPPALLEKGHEPLAANLKQGRDSFRFGVHQLAASILGVGLDTLVQRGERKRRLKTQLIMAGMTALAVIMSGFAFTTFKAQKAAEKSRDDAERLVEYMVSDLKSELYSLQRLDILDGLGEEIITYYEGLDPDRLPDEKLVRLITAIQTLAEVSILERNFEKSERYLADASRLIDVLERRDTDSDNGIFYRAQNEFWEGQAFFKQTQFEKTLPYWQSYYDLSYKLHERAPENKTWLMEIGWAEGNLGLVHRELQNFSTSLPYNQKAVSIFERIYSETPNNIFVAYEYANLIAGLSNTEAALGNKSTAIHLREKEINIYSGILKESKKDLKALYYRNQAKYRLLKLKEYSICDAEEYLPVFNEIKNLVEYETKNADWKREYVRQWIERLENCNSDYSSDISASPLTEFMGFVEKKENQAIFEFFRNRIEKLRANARSR